MTLKILGVIFVFFSCGSVGFRIASNYRAEERALRNLVAIFEFMECELRFHLTPMPILCRQVAVKYPSPPGPFFESLANQMDSQVSPNMEVCVNNALEKQNSIPPITAKTIRYFGKTAGRFDLDGQLKCLNAVCVECKRNLELLSNNRETRMRSYQTLGLCAGAALAILLI